VAVVGAAVIDAMAGCQDSRVASSSSSQIATGSQQARHSPPKPTLVMKAPHSSQRCTPNALVSQVWQAYTVNDRRGTPGAGTTTGTAAVWLRSRQAFFRQPSEQYWPRPSASKRCAQTGHSFVAPSSRHGCGGGWWPGFIVSPLLLV
jgi:hypothetical protein